MLLKVLFLIFTFIFVTAAFAGENCADCHKDIESSCGLQCMDCHGSPNAEYRPALKDGRHAAVIANPSNERWLDEKCLSCHEKQVKEFRNSSHYSASHIIGQTRYLLGKTESIICARETWKTLIAENAANGHTAADLVDNLLAKKCLACHFSADARDDAAGKKRSAGCAACHIPLDQQSGKPLFAHKMQKKVKDTVCLTCHNGNHIGADYYGYFEHDYHSDYDTPYGSKPLFGAYQHRLAADVHQQAGMSCTDCHKQKDNTHKYQNISCENCHGGFKETGRSKAAKFDPTIIAHKNFHGDISCSACHAQWSFQDYGMHLFLDESRNYEMWENTAMQGDIQVSRYLNRVSAMKTSEIPGAESANRLSGQRSKGIWYKGWTFRRWEEPPLAKDKNGKYSIMRPLYQYFITYVDADENVWLDSEIPRRKDGQRGWAWDIYSPHTIGKTGRACESCHGNPKAAGLGIRQNRADSVSNSITLPSEPITPGARLLNQDEINKLMNKSPRYKKWRALEFKSKGVDILIDDILQKK